MPTAGDEGYEVYVVCPYDKSHEIRRGRLQFHLDKCRKNFPEKSKELIQCPFNSVHLIPRCEENFHTQEECSSRADFDRYTHQIGNVSCPVKDLVPVNSHTSNVDADENWDDFEVQGSVLNTIKQNAGEKPVLRVMQCESKAKRKNFRMEERKRYGDLYGKSKDSPAELMPFTTLEVQPMRRPMSGISLPIMSEVLKSDDAAATLPYTKNSASSSSNIPQHMASKSSASSSWGDCNESEVSYASAPSSRPASSLSFASAHSSVSASLPSEASHASGRYTTPKSDFPSLGKRPTSVPSYTVPTAEAGFCQVPIPGLGRGSRRKGQN